MLKPLGHNVLIRMKDREEESRGGIVIPKAAQEVERWGEVIGVGELTTNLEAGDIVFVSANQGTHYAEGGYDNIILDERQVYCKLIDVAA